MNQTLLKNINIVDTINNTILFNKNILIQNEYIIDIKDQSRINYNRNCDVIDCSNKWGIPSFIDMHAHLTFEGREHYGVNFSYGENQEHSFLRISQNLIEALLSGICLLRDVGDKGGKLLIVQKLIDNKIILAPDLILCGEPLCHFGGHGSEFGQTLENQSIESILDRHKEDYEWIKIMNGPELFNQETMNFIVNQAHLRKIKVAAHVFTKPGIEIAINAGVDTIEHAFVYNEKLAAIAREKNIYFVPTYHSSWISLSKNYLSTLFDEIIVNYLQQWYELLNDTFDFHLESQLPILSGTDAGAAPCTFSDIISEIKFLNKKGLSSIDAIKSATILPAEVLGRKNLYGSISKDKFANLIIYDENPLDDINILNNNRVVWFKGIRLLDKFNTNHIKLI